MNGNTRSYSINVTCSSDSVALRSCPLLVSARGGGLPLNFRADDDDFDSNQISLNCSAVRYCILNFTSPNVERLHYLSIVNVANASLNINIFIKTSGMCLRFLLVYC